ncbi:GTPase [Mycoplasmopsis cynos]|uniref:GTPase n=1 Tax=Mycoplasmopsis cynos TaxID=171284 RepID=UPI003A5C884D
MARFIDEITISVQAGKGGNGMISFRREAHVDKGGLQMEAMVVCGGHIYFVGDLGKNTLLSFYKNKHIIAEDGVNGGPKNLYGANAKDTYIKVPLSTMVYNGKKLVADVVESNVPYLIASGVKVEEVIISSRLLKILHLELQKMESYGEKFEAKIVLKILSDVGVVGKPSAGKSTFLNAISNLISKSSWIWIHYPSTTIGNGSVSAIIHLLLQIYQV